MNEYKIGQVFTGMYPPEAAEWCNNNDAYVKELAPLGTSRRFQILSLPPLTDEEKLHEAKNKRGADVSSIVVEVDGLLFDGDEKSQERMSRTIVAAAYTGATMEDSTTWVLHDNTIAKVTIKQLATALRKAGETQTSLWVLPYTQAA